MQSSLNRLPMRTPYFTSGIAASVATIPEKLFSVWLARGTVRPERRGRLEVGGKQRRGQEVFSVLRIVEARFTYRLVNNLAITASEANKVAGEALAGDWDAGDWKPGSWQWPVWRSLTQERAFSVYLLISRIENCWNIDFCVKKLTPPKFDQKITKPFAVVPVGFDIWSIHWECREIYRALQMKDA